MNPVNFFIIENNTCIDGFFKEKVTFFLSLCPQCSLWLKIFSTTERAKNVQIIDVENRTE